jgi:hypothetical protein
MEEMCDAARSRLLEKHAFERDYHPLKWKTALTWEKDGIVKFIRIGRRCFLDRGELEKLLSQGGRQFAHGWRRTPSGS